MLKTTNGYYMTCIKNKQAHERNSESKAFLFQQNHIHFQGYFLFSPMKSNFPSFLSHLNLCWSSLPPSPSLPSMNQLWKLSKASELTFCENVWLLTITKASFNLNSLSSFSLERFSKFDISFVFFYLPLFQDWIGYFLKIFMHRHYRT